MAKGRDRPRHQPKRKPKEKVHKIQPTTPTAFEPPMQVEVIRPKRKEREPQDEE